MKKPQRKFSTVRGFIRYLRADERRYKKQSEEYPAKTDTDKWMKAWLDGTANALGWAADELRRLK